MTAIRLFIQMWFIRIFKKCVYCKSCGRYREYKSRKKSCVCGSTWKRIEDCWWDRQVPWRWIKRRY